MSQYETISQQVLISFFADNVYVPLYLRLWNYVDEKTNQGLGSVVWVRFKHHIPTGGVGSNVDDRCRRSLFLRKI